MGGRIPGMKIADLNNYFIGSHCNAIMQFVRRYCHSLWNACNVIMSTRQCTWRMNTHFQEKSSKFIFLQSRLDNDPLELSMHEGETTNCMCDAISLWLSAQGNVPSPMQVLAIGRLWWHNFEHNFDPLDNSICQL